ncbi:MAG: glycosyltransferase [Candidatus Aenigmatarchaeota archaeon]
MIQLIDKIVFYIAVYATLFISIFWFVTYFLFKDKKISHTKNHPSLSIIIPAYNEEKNIHTCISSLLEQDYPNLKLIIVDDGSTDKTGKVIKNLMKQNKNIIYIRNSHGGKGSALNTGLKHVHTELFGFIDADTSLSAGALESMVNQITKNTAAVITNISPKNTKSIVERIQKIEYVISSFTRKLMSHIQSLYYTPGFAIYKTDVVKSLGGFDEHNITEDLEMGLRLKNAGYNIESAIEHNAYTFVPGNFRKLFRQRIRWYRGYIQNTRKYSHIFFNRKFGDLGLLVLPGQYIVLALIMITLGLSIYNFSVDVYKTIANVLVVNDIGYLLQTAKFNIITATTFFLAVIIVSFFLMLKLSQKNIKESISHIDYVIYIAVYPFINLLLWVAALIYEIAGAEKKW